MTASVDDLIVDFETRASEYEQKLRHKDQRVTDLESALRKALSGIREAETFMESVDRLSEDDLAYNKGRIKNFLKSVAAETQHLV